jgi:hypothetical protein
MDSSAMSFEAKIAMALGGSSWQSLQGGNTDHGNAAGNAPNVDGEEYDDGDDNMDGSNGVLLEQDNAVPGAPQEPVVDQALVKKRQKRLEQFGKTVARDAGEVLETIDANMLTPISQNVAWDQEPELLCCYNWQASTDGTNTIFGT